MTISWIIDHFCNLRCGHCYVDSVTKQTTNRISDNEIRQICKNISTISPEGIIISGGEPLLHPNLFSYLRETGRITEKLWICSNATVITRELIRRIKDFAVAGFSISLESPKDFINDQIRGQGSTRKIITAISLLRESGFDLIIDVTLMKDNIDHIELFFDFLTKYGIEKITFTRFRPIGRGARNKMKFSYNQSRHKEVLEKIVDCVIRYRDKVKVSVHDPLYEIVLSDYCSKNGLEISSLRSSQSYGCKAGTFWVGIGPNGDVSPCPLLLNLGVVIGNVLQQGLKEIIDNSKMIKKIQRRRSGINGCKNLGLCGCCLAHTYSCTQNLFAKDPMCWV